MSVTHDAHVPQSPITPARTGQPAAPDDNAEPRATSLLSAHPTRTVRLRAEGLPPALDAPNFGAEQARAHRIRREGQMSYVASGRTSSMGPS